uniref:Uncharacterized protein n=1 Tax=Plectus sambesii TaxID=2011161 RepID=A0A914W6G0_9BILA
MKYRAQCEQIASEEARSCGGRREREHSVKGRDEDTAAADFCSRQRRNGTMEVGWRINAPHWQQSDGERRILRCLTRPLAPSSGASKAMPPPPTPDRTLARSTARRRV